MPNRSEISANSRHSSAVDRDGCAAPPLGSLRDNAAAQQQRGLATAPAAQSNRCVQPRCPKHCGITKQCFLQHFEHNTAGAHNQARGPSPCAHPLLDTLGRGLARQQVKLVDRHCKLEGQSIGRGRTRPAAAAVELRERCIGGLRCSRREQRAAVVKCRRERVRGQDEVLETHHAWHAVGELVVVSAKQGARRHASATHYVLTLLCVARSKTKPCGTCTLHHTV